MTRRTLLGVIALVVAAIAVPRAQTAAEKALIKIENDWSTAWVKKDKAALERLYSTEYLFTDPDGVTHNRTEDIADTISPDTQSQAFALSDLKVHIYGQTAIVTGANMLKATVKGTDISGAYRFTDVFVNRDGRWQVVATQSTKIAKK